MNKKTIAIVAGVLTILLLIGIAIVFYVVGVIYLEQLGPDPSPDITIVTIDIDFIGYQKNEDRFEGFNFSIIETDLLNRTHLGSIENISTSVFQYNTSDYFSITSNQSMQINYELPFTNIVDDISNLHGSQYFLITNFGFKVDIEFVDNPRLGCTPIYFIRIDNYLNSSSNLSGQVSIDYEQYCVDF